MLAAVRDDAEYGMGTEVEQVIVILDDDVHYREEIVEFLRIRGFLAEGVGDGAALERRLDQGGAALVVVDVVLRPSGEDGLAIVRRLRGLHPELGLVVLTCLDGTAVHVEGLESGADAFLAKGGDLLILEATLRNLLARRRGGLAGPREESRPRGAGSGAVWRLGVTTWRLWAPNGAEVELTHLEYRFLQRLTADPSRNAQRGDLLQAMGKRFSPYESRNLDNVVRRLRRKVERETAASLPVVAVYGIGYAFTAPLKVDS